MWVHRPVHLQVLLHHQLLDAWTPTLQVLWVHRPVHLQVLLHHQLLDAWTPTLQVIAATGRVRATATAPASTTNTCRIIAATLAALVRFKSESHQLMNCFRWPQRPL